MSDAERELALLDDDSFYDAHEELRERSRRVSRLELNGVPTTVYWFGDESALSLSDHTDYAGNVHLYSVRVLPGLTIRQA